jgi:hypothetical protein
MLPMEAIEEYKKLYEKRFGVILNDTEASLRANNLVNFYKATLGSEELEIQDQQNYDKE